MSFGADGQWFAIGWLQPAKGCRGVSSSLSRRCHRRPAGHGMRVPVMPSSGYTVVRDRSDRVVPVRTRACLAHGDAGDTRGMTAHMNVNPKAGNRALPGVSSRSREGSGLRVSTSEIGESN